MEAVLIGEELIRVFTVKTQDNQELFVTWNKNNHTENKPGASAFIPEFEVEDDQENILEQGCQDWEDAVASVKQWYKAYVEVERI